ncbi:pyridoxal-phosphate-dependent aminotransferase family protein [Geoalkalibacter halelectricus]|uniref:Alanine--glyoxylate aminotransferase family protein n=1 Tax=Geoalkalibacter halelectricus TaxID=2847045 RepID=A0ABY5ZHF2_9BACT|nr:alanine--glyoxylate aminotransferase family protein [Geoalkalibacter halelectricus]MDO3378024.1 alanine--glyoxylate aminotransferase family protein [Geoalkalibacter halelectricus]UWZ78324.1 alanine--glyoxylate aminotransferase family protein [Geoalkalibacter halelectricus]
MHKKLYIPGPVEVAPDVMEAMCAPMIGHRMKEYALVHEKVTRALKQLLNTQEPVFLSTSSAFGVMEGAVRNLVQKRCACFGNGAFSSKWHDVTRRCGIEADLFSASWGEPISATLVDQALRTGKYDAMTMVHNETSTGVMSPLEEIAEVMKNYPQVSFIVDTVSSMSAVPLDLERLGTDVCLAGVQKAFGLPPGLAVFAVSRRALGKARSTPNRGYYFDFDEFEQNDLKHNTPSTPCISLIYALAHQLDKMFAEGLEQRYARHARMAEATRAWVQDQGFGLFAAAGARSQTLTCARNDERTDLEVLKKLAAERGYAIDNGYGKIKNQTFRIPHMADMTLEDLEELFTLLEELLPQARK